MHEEEDADETDEKMQKTLRDSQKLTGMATGPRGVWMRTMCRGWRRYSGAVANYFRCARQMKE